MFASLGSGSVKTEVLMGDVVSSLPMHTFHSASVGVTLLVPLHANLTSLYQCGGSMSGPWVSFGVPMFRHAISLARAFSVGVERYRVIRFRDISYDAEVLTGSAGLPSNSNSFKTLALVKPAPRGHQGCTQTQLRLLPASHGHLCQSDVYL